VLEPAVRPSFVAKAMPVEIGTAALQQLDAST